jgi:hypothetical protein
MANKIQIKRSTANATVTGLANGELAYTANSEVLFIGSPNGNGLSIAIGSRRYPGVLTANHTLVANASSYLDKVWLGTEVLVGNSTVNSYITPTSISVSNSTGTANLTAFQLNIGANVFANTTAFDVGNTIITSTNLTLGGNINANASVGTSGQVLTSTGNGVQWSTVSGGGSEYTLPVASDTTLGGIKIGAGLSIDVDGIVTGFSGVYGDLTSRPTIPNAIFKTIAVSGQTDIVADSATDTLTFVAGDNITITTNATNDSITINSTGGGGGGGEYTLPAATTSTLGGVKIGNGLSVDVDGVIDVIGASGSTASGVVPYDMGYITEIVYTVQDHGSIV